MKIVSEFPNSQYAGLSYLRLMIISYTFNRFDEFMRYYEKLSAYPDLDKEDVNKAHYLVAHHLVQQRQYKKATEILGKIGEDSKYFPVAQYLFGSALLNLDKYSQAKKVFQNLVAVKNYPWTDLNISLITNESLLKLGFLEYHLGEYEKAISYFDQISKGFEK